MAACIQSMNETLLQYAELSIDDDSFRSSTLTTKFEMFEKQSAAWK